MGYTANVPNDLPGHDGLLTAGIGRGITFMKM